MRELDPVNAQLASSLPPSGIVREFTVSRARGLKRLRNEEPMRPIRSSPIRTKGVMKIARIHSGFFSMNEFTINHAKTPTMPFQKTAMKMAPPSFVSGEYWGFNTTGPPIDGEVGTPGKTGDVPGKIGPAERLRNPRKDER